jgi:hypothetical protein
LFFCFNNSLRCIIQLFFKLFFTNPGQTRTVVNDRIRRNTTIYMMPYYDRISPYRIRRNTAINGEENGRLRSSFTESVYDYRFAPYFPVYHRISPYTVTEKNDRNTGSCNTQKYVGIRS